MTDLLTAPAARVTSYPPDAILTPEEAAAWLDVSVKTLLGYPIRRIELGRSTIRFKAARVYEYLDGHER